jgi:proprotein convertase subtilisin/kexin type 5
VLTSNGQSCDYNCRIEGCVTCSGASNCSLCNDGSQLNTANTACVVQCSDGFYLESKKCKACPTNCLTCDSTGKCTSCVSLYYLDSADSFKCKACSTITSCYDCEASQAVCKTCIAGFSLINSICYDNSKCSVKDCKTCMANNPVACQTC